MANIVPTVVASGRATRGSRVGTTSSESFELPAAVIKFHSVCPCGSRRYVGKLLILTTDCRTNLYDGICACIRRWTKCGFPVRPLVTRNHPSPAHTCITASGFPSSSESVWKLAVRLPRKNYRQGDLRMRSTLEWLSCVRQLESGSTNAMRSRSGSSVPNFCFRCMPSYCSARLHGCKSRELSLRSYQGYRGI